jgi:RNA polymerase sigma-70 factor (ECF subfamily)
MDKMHSQCEAELVARCCRGEAEAWDALFEKYYASTGRFVFQLASDFTREDVEEVCQETFLTVIKNLNSFHGKSQFQTWLFRVAANKARDYRQRLHATKRGGGQPALSLQAEDGEHGLTIDLPSNAPGPDDQLLNAEATQLVGQALHRLDPPCQELIQLRYFGDLSYEQISQALRLNHKTVSSRLSRCLDRLQAIYNSMIVRGKSAHSPSNPYAV